MNKESMNVDRDELTADDITEIKLTMAEYHWKAGYNAFDFTCRINGENDVLHMTEQRLDDGSGFVIHSEKDDIWDKLKPNEAFKLEGKLQEAIQYCNYHNRIEELKNPDDCKEMEFELMENNNIHLKRVIKKLWDELEVKQAEIKEMNTKPNNTKEIFNIGKELKMKLKTGDIIKTELSDNTMVLNVSNDQAVLFTEKQFVIASGIKENEKSGKVEWDSGQYTDDLAQASNMQNNNFEAMKDTLAFLSEYNHRDFVKSIISIETGISNETVLNNAYDNYMNDYVMGLVDDKFLDFIDEEMAEENINHDDVHESGDVSEGLKEKSSVQSEIQEKAIKDRLRADGEKQIKPEAKPSTIIKLKDYKEKGGNIDRMKENVKFEKGWER